jgi:hypothetical protein
MTIKKKQVSILLFALLSIPFWMWLSWLLTSKKKLVAIIVDKTVEKPVGEQHASFTWVLNHDRFSKTKTSLYKNNRDYFGFFPLENEKFRVKGLERFSTDFLDKLSNDADMVYFTDTYGVYKNDWYQNNKEGQGILYGGMSDQDIQLLQMMKSKHKLIVSEFNTIGSPTSEKVRTDFENLFGLKWTGWIGCYFVSLDPSINADLPQWIVNNYKRNYHTQWLFHNAGIVFLNTSGSLVVLEEGKDLTEALPVIQTSEANQKIYELPSESGYAFWFDVMQYDNSLNHVVSEFKIKTNPTGQKILDQNNIPQNFPAILTHKNKDYQFYYFSGNFCDNPVSMSSSYFKGISFFKRLFYTNEDADRRSFFWNFYLPLMSHITNDYFETTVKK